MDLLRVENVSRRFGGLHAIQNCSLSIGEKEIVALVGPNGSGKTTLFNIISGIIKPTTGRVYFKDQRIDGTPLFKIAKMGMSRTFQVTRIFKNMTVSENLAAVAPKSKSGGTEIDKVLSFFNLQKLRDEYASNLSYGQQKLLEFARAFITDPALVLLDEPASGIFPAMLDELASHIQKARALGKSIFLIEHNMRFVMRLSDRVIVLNHGEKIAEGSPDEVRNNRQVIESYFGNQK